MTMIRHRLFALLALTCLAAAQAAPLPEPTCFVPGKKFDNRLAGNWEIAPLNVRYSIRAKGREVCVYARDVQADEYFEIPELQWDGKVLEIGFYLASTKWSTRSRLSVENADLLRDEYSTPKGPRTDFWTRRK
ncbi:hypothetical protein [Uliginosibacterium aquaticum]|uniref:Uncharacterized protein n=1 Tax=Uliginosibacterium aquaticum TaxID=2731212 RepID=A0ABX2INR6_9RHOO|nr:hypothetical protein [Uliginosibacterium aquaticum]NSL55675.1 hypothetical protein [Uliginosibacterium aquaticum]